MESDTNQKIEEAEAFKTKGNELFKEGHYEQAQEAYSKAIETNISDKRKMAIYYANRAFVNIKLENYGFAVDDGTQAINKDPTYPKGYYRRGSAQFALGKYQLALQNFKRCLELVPGDSDTIEKYNLVNKLYRAEKLAEAISVDVADDFTKEKIIEIDVPSTYDGPKLEENEPLTPEWCVNLMEWMKNQKVLHKKYLWMILFRVREILKGLPSLVEVDVPEGKEITVCGDTHGQFYDLLNIFKLNNNPSADNPYLFNGDFVDRGSFSVEVILCLLAWKVCDPKCMHLTRGNHEAKSMNKLYGFEGEVTHKYDAKTYDIFCDVFNYLPLAYVLKNKVMVCHGGLFSQDGVKLEDIKKIDRHREPPESGLMCELLWSDPHPQNGRHPSKRGVGIGFGPDVSHKFLDDNKLSMNKLALSNSLALLVRSHEMKQNGYEEEANGRVITIFSAPNYCDQMGNKGAYIRFNGTDMKPNYTTFPAVEHPKIPVMAYARNFMPWM